MHRIIKVNQKPWLTPYNEIKAELKKNAKIDFKKDFFKLMNNSAFENTLKNVRKHRDIKLVTTEKKKRYYLVSESNYHGTKFFTKN